MNDRAGLRGRRGVALPVALVGLVAVSLLVTTALLTSTSEYAISSAQTEGTRSLYAGENGMHAYIEQLANQGAIPGLIAPGMVQTITVPVSQHPVRTAQVQVSTDLLSQGQDAAGATIFRYAVTAQPLGEGGGAQGRAVVSMIELVRPVADPLNLNISSAIALAGDLDVNGNAFTVNGRFNGCGVTGGVDAVEASETSSITANNERHFDNFLGYEDGRHTSGTDAINKTEMSKEELVDKVLGGATLEGLVNSIPNHKRWGPKFDRPAWGGTLADTALVAVVDANGGTVEVFGGRGILIVINGNMRMRGNAKFEGIIIVEGNFDLAGTPTVKGALISLSNDTNNLINLDESAIGAGHITVQYDKCAIDSAQSGFGQASVPPLPVLSRTAFAWVDVVR